MKRFCIFTVIFLFMGICIVTAQDLIVMKDGKIIEARITEISQTEIRYKRFDHLDGPTIVIPAAQVLTVRYENGRTETISAAIPVPAQTNNQAVRPNNTAINPNKFIFGFNVNAGGAIIYSSGPSIDLEFSKGNFNSEINIMFPGFYAGGFGGLFTFNYFRHSRIGGGYIGGGIGLGFNIWEGYFSMTIGLNAGYKFVTRSGVYFRTGAFVGFEFGYLWTNRRYSFVIPVYFKPDFAIGWTMR